MEGQLDAAIAGERNPSKLDFKVIISLKIFDRNLRVRFHKGVVAAPLQKSPMHGLVFGWCYINS